MQWLKRLAVVGFVLALTPTVYAHVKWFTDFSFADEPLSLGEVITPTFIGLAVLSFVVIGALVLVDRRLSDLAWYNRVNDWLSTYRGYAPVILRVGLGMTLLLAWQAESLFVPQLNLTEAWVGWAQFVLVLLLLFPTTTPVAGIGVILLFVYGIAAFGFFYMLDYVHFLGVAYYLIVFRVRDLRVQGTGIPALYLSLGFSLCWLAIEKLIYPGWAGLILQENPQLTLGLQPDFFLTAAAFVEFSLGYLLIICLLQRPLSLVVTLVFFTTTLVFGKVEVIGHTLLHAMLLVFLVEGPGRIYAAPITFHKRLPLRVAFAAVNFLIVLAVLLVPYAFGARATYEAYVQQNDAPQEEDTPVEETVSQLAD